MPACFILLAFISSCKKQQVDQPDFYGTWEIQSSISYSAPSEPLQTYAPASGKYIDLRSDGTINWYKENKLERSATFQISKKNITGCKFNDLREYWAITYQNHHHHWIQLDNNTLTISTPPCWEDGGTTTYVRVNK